MTTGMVARRVRQNGAVPAAGAEPVRGEGAGEGAAPVGVPVAQPRRRAPEGRSGQGSPGSDPPAAPAPSASALDPAELAARRGALEELMAIMRPAVQADGGDLELVDADVAAGVVEVRLRGACSTCAIASATLQGGVERILRERLPWIVEVRGGVDEEEDPLASLAAGRGAYVPRF